MSDRGSPPLSSSLSPPLSPAAQDLLRMFRDDESPTELDRRRGLRSVQARLDEPVARGGGRFYAKVVAATVLLAAAVLLAVKALGVGVTALASQAREPAMEAPYQGAGTAEGGQVIERTPPALPRRARPVPERTAVAVEPETADLDAIAVEPEPAAPEAVAVEPEPAAPASRSRAAASARAPAPVQSTVEDLQAELSLIKRARAAKQEGRPAAGLSALAEHARRFPRGTLADERRVMKAELLCAAGRVGEARALVRRFLKQRAGSALAGRMSGVCSEP